MKQYFAVGNWHDAGTGPFPTITYDVLSNWDWRDKPQEFKREIRYQAPAQGEREAPIVVATAILGGIFHGGSGPELGEIDIEVCTSALEKIQCETVNSSDDAFLPLMTVAQHERIVAALTRPAQTAPSVCMGCVDLSSHARELQHKMDYYKAQTNELQRLKDLNDELLAGLAQILYVGENNRLRIELPVNANVTGSFTQDADTAVRNAIHKSNNG